MSTRRNVPTRAPESEHLHLTARLRVMLEPRITPTLKKRSRMFSLTMSTDDEGFKKVIEYAYQSGAIEERRRLINLLADDRLNEEASRHLQRKA
jgi:uncharacterized protein involved in exopolysaccharide biosynthesis